MQPIMEAQHEPIVVAAMGLNVLTILACSPFCMGRCTFPQPLITDLPKKSLPQSAIITCGQPPKYAVSQVTPNGKFHTILSVQPLPYWLIPDFCPSTISQSFPALNAKKTLSPFSALNVPLSMIPWNTTFIASLLLTLVFSLVLRGSSLTILDSLPSLSDLSRTSLLMNINLNVNHA